MLDIRQSQRQRQRQKMTNGYFSGLKWSGYEVCTEHTFSPGKKIKKYFTKITIKKYCKKITTMGVTSIDKNEKKNNGENLSQPLAPPNNAMAPPPLQVFIDYDYFMIIIIMLVLMTVMTR